MKPWTLILLLTGVLQAGAQNLTGTWIGRANPNDYIRLELIHIGDSVYGMAYDEGGGGFCRTDFAGSFAVSGKRLRGRTENFIDRTPNHTLTDYSMRFEKRDDADYLTGIVRPRSTFAKILTLGMGTPAILRRIRDEVDTTAFMRANVIRLAQVKPPPPVPVPDTVAVIVPPPPPPVPADTPVIIPPRPPMPVADSMRQVKEQRQSPVVATIGTAADSVQLFIYDEGDIDGDTVSLFVNNQMLLNRFMISARPGVLTIPVTKQQPVEVVLVAHNLGSIPPNTALLIIKAGKERHEIRAAFDLNVNARILIQYKE